MFVSTDKALAEQVAELCVSLGLKPSRSDRNETGFGLTVHAWRVEFAPVGFNPFTLPRKADQVTFGTGSVAQYRIVRSVEPGPDVDTQCIVVDSPNRTFLCGRDMIPTHNSGDNQIQKAAYLVQPVPYAFGQPYDWSITMDDRRAGDNGLRPWADSQAPARDWALICHVPLDPEHAESAALWWVDLESAVNFGRMAAEIRSAWAVTRAEARKSFRPVPPAEVEDEDLAARWERLTVAGPPAMVKVDDPAPISISRGIELRIEAAKTPEAVLAVFHQYQHSGWTHDHAQLADRRYAELLAAQGHPEPAPTP